MDEVKSPTKKAGPAIDLEALKKQKPSPLGIAADADLIQAANYEEHLKLLKDCDLVIEAATEREDLKHKIFATLVPHLKAEALVA